MTGASPAKSLIRLGARLGGVILDALLPPRCLSCGGEVERQGGLCATCWTALRFISQPLCARCGAPFAFAQSPVLPPLPSEAAFADALVCGACMAEAPPYHRARAVFVYDDASRRLILGFKHADRIHGAPAFGEWMARAGTELLSEADLLVPVPLHRWRLFLRRYNQAALLATAAGRVAGVAVIPDLLQRRRRTPSQGHLDRAQRRRNVAGAFAVRARGRERIAGRNLVLVDDVLTSGATVGECARVLLAAGAARVEVLTLARVTRG